MSARAPPGPAWKSPPGYRKNRRIGVLGLQTSVGFNCEVLHRRSVSEHFRCRFDRGITKISYMKTPPSQSREWDTNFGWWAEKPARPERPTTGISPLRPVPGKAASIWSEAALVVGLAMALVLSLISLATR